MEFFHKLMNSHCRNNAINVLHDGDIIISDKEAIEEHVVHFF